MVEKIIKYMKYSWLFALITCFIIWTSGCIKEETFMEYPEVKAGEIKNPKYSFASMYKKEGFLIEGRAPQYNLPLPLEEIKNWEEISNILGLNENQTKLLEQNGFVAIPYGGEDIIKPYHWLINKNIPIFITSDTLLHMYHILFNELLKSIEEREFYSSLINLSKALFEKSKREYEEYDGLLKEAARRNAAYFCVALKLLQPDSEIPDFIREDVEKELKNIEGAKGFGNSILFGYAEDYSQYKPRGHYAESEKLKRYFKTMMWFGRMTFLLKGGEPHCSSCPFLISEEDANIQTIQASLISYNLANVEVEGKKAFEVWQHIYAITSFFVGLSDDLTPYEYLEGLHKIFNENFSVELLTAENNLLQLKTYLASLENPKIYGGSGKCEITPPITKDKLYEVLNKTKGMRFMGQRFLPDSYIFQQLVSPAVGMYVGDGEAFTAEYTPFGKARCFPRGLDVMAVLGSDRALEILEEEGDTAYKGENTSYYIQMEKLREEFNAFNATEWNRNLYWSWLYTLKALLTEFDEKYPKFMQTVAWKDKELQTALASWTELRHDTILYGKQSYTIGITGLPAPSPGYVEPLPEFYARLKALTNMTKEGLKKFGVINESEMGRLNKLEYVLSMVFEISVKELEGEELDDSDYLFIRMFPDMLNETVAGIKTKGKETTIVADVHTDINTKKGLEEAVGYVDLVIVAYPTEHGIYAGAGPIMSYYEFKQPMENRLTDEEWRDILNTSPPPRPSWISSFFAE
ncbi:MAG TPA: DUF3160 domain-containing protein [Thermoplasmatales archaeon]|nr:DUF3160 domain-containing protein [Thermoplasmatales archaeon]